jgi:hypothetical protein
MRRFRPGQLAGTMSDAGLSITQDMATQLNEIVLAYEDFLDEPVGGRLERLPDGGLYAEPEVPETFHARLAGSGPAYAWEEVARTSTGWETPAGVRTSASDGTAREYNGATGLGLLVVLMQRWPNGVHRFVSPGVGDRTPVVECPTTLKVRVRSWCNPSAVVAGATVTAKDTADVLDDVAETTGSDGVAELVLDNSGGTFNITVELADGCTETIEGVVMVPCERRTLPDVAPCCGEVCFEVYDYDTGDPVEGAEVSTVPGGLLTDSAGVVCMPPLPLQSFGTGFQHQITHPDYLPFNEFRLCFPCDCSPDAEGNHPTALFPKATYVAGGLGAVSTLAAPCYTEPDCLPARIDRDPSIFKRVMYAEIDGPEAIFGGGGTTTLTVVNPDAVNKRWEGVAPSGGYGYQVTRVFNAALNTFVETGRTRFDFPLARVFLFGENSIGGPRAGLEFANYVDAGGTTRATTGHVFSASGTPGTDGYTEVILEAERYCPLASNPAILLYAFPFAVVNYRAVEPGGTTQADICGDVDELGFPKWCSDGARTVYPCSFATGSGRSGACAPVDVSGAFWCGRDCASGPYGGDTLLSTYSLYE